MSIYKFTPLILTTLALVFIGGASQLARAQITIPTDSGLTDSSDDEDGEPVRIISDVSNEAVTSALQNTLTAENTAKIAEGIEALVEKEKTLDPSAWAASKEFQQQLISEILKWLGGQGEGGDGKIPFVTSYDQRGSAVADKSVGSYLFSNKAGDSNAQCNVESSHKVRTAVYNAYLKARQDAQQGGALACETQDSSSQDQNHTSLLHKLLGDFANCRDELCQAFDTQRELYSRAVIAQADDLEAIRNARGFIPQRVCRNANDASGQSRQVCEIVSPPSLAADVASFGLVELPGLSLLNVDEFDEVVSNTMSNLTNQLINGQNGALGLSGNQDYAQNAFGENGNLSYADALAEEDISNYQTGGGSGGNYNPIANKLKVEETYRALMEEIVTTIEGLEDKLDDNREKFPSCFDLKLTNKLSTTKKEAATGLASTIVVIEVLTGLNQQYQSAESSAARNDVLRAFMQLKNQGVFHTNQENRQLEVTFINLAFTQSVERFKYDTALARKECGGSFDYERNAGGGGTSI